MNTRRLRFILHDNQRFEAGSANHRETVERFLRRRNSTDATLPVNEPEGTCYLVGAIILCVRFKITYRCSVLYRLSILISPGCWKRATRIGRKLQGFRVRLIDKVRLSIVRIRASDSLNVFKKFFPLHSGIQLFDQFSGTQTQTCLYLYVRCETRFA